MGKKVWLNNKYIKLKRNKKFKSKFFKPFQVFYAVGKQTYKQELPTKEKIYNVFHISLLEQDTTKKKQVNKTLPEPKKDFEFEVKGDKKYKVEAIINSIIYGQ